MYICKENKSPSHEKMSSNYFSLDECKININILESIIEYIRSIEETLKKIIQQNINLKNQIKNKSLLIDYPEQDDELILKKYSYGETHIEKLEKMINKFQISLNEENKTLMNEACKVNDKNSYNNNDNINDNCVFEISDEIKEIKNYYEGKMDIMQKKIKVFEILENLYLKQIEEFKKKSNKNISNKLIKINENLMNYNHH